MPNVEDPELISFLQAFANETLPNLRTTKAQAFLLVLSFIVAAGLSWSQVDGHLNLINALFGCDVLPRTKFMLRKLWNLEKSKFLKFHYYCSTCTNHLGMESFSTDKKKFLRDLQQKLQRKTADIQGVILLYIQHSYAAPDFAIGCWERAVHKPKKAANKGA